MTLVNININERRAIRRDASPLTYIVVTPKTETPPGGGANVTIAAADGELTEITPSNTDATIGNGFARAAYNYVNADATSRYYVLPFVVDVNDAVGDRLTKVIAAIDSAMGNSVERAKLPNGEFDIVVVSRESGLGTTDGANPVLTALEIYLERYRARAIVDAGPYASDPNDATPSNTAVVGWEANNVNHRVMSITNRGDIVGYTNMWGSVIVAGHVSRVWASKGLGAHVATLRDPVLGADNFRPDRSFDPDVATDTARTLANSPNYMTSLINWNGASYLWGGKTQQASENSPIAWFNRQVIIDRMAKQTKRDLLPFIVDTATPRLLSSIQLTVQNDLTATYVATGLVTGVTVLDVTLSGETATVIVEVQFGTTIERFTFVIDVFE